MTLRPFSDSLANLSALGGGAMDVGDNFQTWGERSAGRDNARDFAAVCSLEAWEGIGKQSRTGGQPADSAPNTELGFLDLDVNDPLLVAQAVSGSKSRTTDNARDFGSPESQVAQEGKPVKSNEGQQHHYYQSLFLHQGDTTHGLKGRFDDPGHAAVQVEDTGTGFKSDIVGLGPDKSVLLHPLRTKGSLHRDTDDCTFEMQVRREISKEDFDEMRKHVKEEIDMGDIGYGVLLPKQCTTEAIKLSSFGGWAIETPKEKVSPFLPAQVTPNSLYDTFSKPQPIDLTNLDENGKPRVLEVFDLNRTEPVIDRNRDAFEE